ncbi:MAG: histidine ammonia-lyase [Anaerolineaceae bacterium]|nr:histidine ammonia-lyase [Anaerolineaceae bacterium]
MIKINGSGLTLEEIAGVAREGKNVGLSEEGRTLIRVSRKRLETILGSHRPVYGINTGFGIFADRRIPDIEAATLSRNLILSHAVGTGTDLNDEVVRSAMLVRANTLTKGFSGVREEIVQTLVAMLNKGVTPSVPSQGSLGSSGDLCPLSHMALVFTTDEKDRDEDSGWACYKGVRLTGKQAMHEADIVRIVLGPKEGLALNNGATFSAALAALAVIDADYLLDLAEYSLALSMEAMLGCSDAYDSRIHRARGQEGQISVAERVSRLLEDSDLIDSSGRVQDAYSMRCAPQVQGAARETVNFARKIVEKEVNAATDNPLIFDKGTVLSGGNFHGEPVGFVCDFMSIAMAEVGAIAERRIFRLTDGKLNAGLPPMLVDRPEEAGLNSGMMIPQYTAASLVLENQTLANPDSVHSLPTSAEQEDHNANSMVSARHTRRILQNLAQILSIELYTAARAIDLRLREKPEAKLGAGTRQIYEKLRSAVPYQAGDAWWAPEINRVRELVDNKEFVVER